MITERCCFTKDLPLKQAGIAMNIKTFRADSLQDGLRQIHEEFGENARIMHAREVEISRLFGLRRQRFFEITAAENKDDPTPQKTEPSAEQPLQTNLYDFPYDLTSTPPVPQYFRSEIGSLNTLNADIQKTSWQPVPLGVWRQLTPEELNPTILQRSLMALFSDSVRFGGPIDLLDGKRKIIAFLGLTGVGKTATIAKIAAHYRLKEFKRVGLVTIDTFRVAATEQLGKYAEMLGLPMETVSEPFRMKTALARLETCDLILLDTPGTNPKNTMKLQMLGAMLDAAKVDEVHLLCSATTHAAALSETFHRFQPLAPTDLTFTKLDEAIGITDLYQFLKTNILPLRFFSLGQNVSEDIEVAGPARLASLAY
jgi:flagellar biosynthesis protein FlhF